MRVGGTGNWQATLAVPDSEEGAELRLLRSIHVAQEVLFQDKLALFVPLIVDVRLVVFPPQDRFTLSTLDVPHGM